MKTSIILLFYVSAFVMSYAQNSIPKLSDNDIQNQMKSAYDLTLSLPKNYVKDGSIDYTRYLQEGINSNDVIKFPDFPVLINSEGLKLVSGNRVFFRNNSKIVMKPNNKVGYAIFWIQSVSNVSLINANMIGDRDNHLDSKGQWGMGIRIIDSKNVLIQNPSIKNCWGDGIYFGDDLNNDIVNDNVLVYNAKIDRSRRNGITITSGRNINIVNAKITNSNGVMPMSGLDIEPNDNRNILHNIYIENLYTKNKGAGLIFSIGQLKGSSQKISIKVNNHVNDSGTMGFYAGRLDYSDKKLGGEIIVNNSVYSNSDNNGILIEGYSGLNSPIIIFNNPKIINANEQTQKSERWGSGIVFLRDSRRNVNHKLGNFVVNNAEILDNRKSPRTRSAFHFIDDRKADFVNTKVTGKIITKGIQPSKIYVVKGRGVLLQNKN